MKIGLIGLTFDSANKGCEALGYGFLNVLQRIAEQRNDKFDIIIFKACDVDKILKNINADSLTISSIQLPGVGSFKHWKSHLAAYKSCDIVFDFTEGDSFSDIYGKKRFVKTALVKSLVIFSKTPLVLGSQTYGPYKNCFCRWYAAWIMKKSKVIFTRDKQSGALVKKISGRETIETVDVAFAMHYTQREIAVKEDKLLVGFNPSGLLWNGGYSRNNQFALQVDYKEYCVQVIKRLLDEQKYTIYLVPHVLSDDLSEADNDMVACKQLQEIFQEVQVTPFFQTPIEAKSFIAGMDVFTGARMHATIAAYTTGVAVVPFSYSPKFEGLFGSLGYKYVISGRDMNTERAIDETIKYIHSCSDLRADIDIKVIENGVQKIVFETDKVIGDE